MGATVFHLLILQTYINSKHKISKQKKYPLCLQNISGDFSANIMKKQVKIGVCTIFLLIIQLLILVILSIYIDI